MPREFKDRVQDTTQTTGTGAFTLDGAAIAGFRTFTSAHTSGASLEYFAGLGSDWEVGIGVLTGSSLTRTPLASSNGGALVNFGAGSKTIFETVSAAQIARALTAQDVVFSTAVPLSTPGSSYMASQTVSGALTFTPAAGAVRGALTYLRLIADGANVPNYSAFKEWGGSTGYLNTSGIENQMQFFFDGFNYWVSISQAINAVPVPLPASGVSLAGPTGGIVNQTSSVFTVGVTPAGGVITGTVTVTPSDGGAGGTFAPTSINLSSGTTSATFTYTPSSTGAKTISVTNNGGLTNPSNITYTVGAAATVPGTMSAPVATAGQGNASLAFVAPSSGTGTISSYAITPYLAGVAQAVQTTTTLTSPYVATGLTAGGAYTFTMHAVSNVGSGGESPASNSVTPTIAYTRLTNLKNVTESGTGPYSYSSASNTTWLDGSGGVSAVLAANTDGSIAQTINIINAANGFLLATSNTQTKVTYTGTTYAVYSDTTDAQYKTITGGNPSNSTGSGQIAQVGDTMRLRRAGTTLIAEFSRSATPTTWVNIRTWTGVPVTATYFQVDISGPGSVGSNITGVNV